MNADEILCRLEDARVCIENRNNDDIVYTEQEIDDILEGIEEAITFVYDHSYQGYD